MARPWLLDKDKVHNSILQYFRNFGYLPVNRWPVNGGSTVYLTFSKILNIWFLFKKVIFILSCVIQGGRFKRALKMEKVDGV